MVVTLETQDPRRRLVDAARRRATIQHPHLVRARVGRDAHGRVSIVMERCSAPRLSQLLAAGALTPTASITVLGCVASAVRALTSHGLVPRDLTPDRILVDRRSGVLLADHGIPLDLVTREAPADDPWLPYRSPEELKGRTPISAAACTPLVPMALLCMTGTEPPDPRLPAPRRRIQGLSPALDKVIKRAMARQPARRYPDAIALARAAHGAVPPRRSRRERSRPGRTCDVCAARASESTSSRQGRSPEAGIGRRTRREA